MREAGSAGRALRSLAPARTRDSKTDAGRDPAELARERLGVLDRMGIHLLAVGHASYPPRLSELYDPPACLFVRGDPEALNAPSVAVVGSRRCTPYGRHAAESIGGALASHGVAVVSGLALGIDGAAHRATVDAGGTPVAVLGNGIDRIHPRSHVRLGRSVLQRGALVSEFPPGVSALAHHFPQRNRILAALSDVVVVVEAAARSGALITAEFALELGRDIYAVPGEMGVRAHEGTLALIRDGAGVVTSPEALLEDVLRTSGRVASSGPKPAAESDGTVEGEAGRLLSVLDDGVRDLDELCRAVRMGASDVLAVLFELELGGRVRQEAGLRFRRV
jgi:DNA processing protein